MIVEWFFNCKGNRAEQQDTLLYGDSFAFVFDGMGGHSRGGDASRIATEFFKSQIASDLTLTEIARGASEKLLDASGPYSRKMSFYSRNRLGTTVAGICFRRKQIIWCGDSRVYRLGYKELLTVDHAYYGALTEFIGQVGVQVGVLDIAPVAGEQYLVCTDGVHGYVEDAELLSGDGSILQDTLAECSEDNYTAILLTVEETDI